MIWKHEPRFLVLPFEVGLNLKQKNKIKVFHARFLPISRFYIYNFSSYSLLFNEIQEEKNEIKTWEELTLLTEIAHNLLKCLFFFCNINCKCTQQRKKIFSGSYPFLKQNFFVVNYFVDSASKKVLSLSDTMLLTTDPATNLIHKGAI